jgi:hypothetical protein
MRGPDCPEGNKPGTRGRSAAVLRGSFGWGNHRMATRRSQPLDPAYVPRPQPKPSYSNVTSMSGEPATMTPRP